MSTFQVLENRPQAIFEQGLQDDFLVSNTGITSVYLDNNSSISLMSYRLRPMSSIVWSGGQPLWAMAGLTPTYDNINDTAIASAQITVTPNHQPPANVSQSFVQAIAQIPSFTGSGASLISFENLEVGHLESITLSFSVPAAWTNNPITVQASWAMETDDTTDFYTRIFEQTFMMWQPDSVLNGHATVHIPIRGPRLALQVIRFAGVLPITDVRLLGNGYRGHAQITNVFGDAIARSAALSPTTTTDDFIQYNGIYDFADIWIQPRSSKLRITLRTHAAVTVAGRLVLIGDSAWYDDLVIPVGAANAILVKDYDVSAVSHLRLVGQTVPTPAPSGSNYSLSILMRDGASI